MLLYRKFFFAVVLQYTSIEITCRIQYAAEPNSICDLEGYLDANRTRGFCICELRRGSRLVGWRQSLEAQDSG